MIFNFMFLILILLNTVSEVFAQYLFKKHHLMKLKNNLYPIIGIILYAICGFFSFKLLNYGEIGIINIIWHLFHFILLFFVGYFFLGERLSNRKIMASIIGLLSLVIFFTDSSNSHH